ncbi:hypothetical protein J4466_03355 [Candidatus Pacearchaeota archaeon]|nr:hypothetical protein [Candidatus Pacearchaeota archaeon]
MKQKEERVSLFYDITRIGERNCFTLYYLYRRENEEELIPIGSIADFHSQFRESYGNSRPQNMEEILIKEILRNNPAFGIPENVEYAAQLLIDKKPVEGFIIENFN